MREVMDRVAQSMNKSMNKSMKSMGTMYEGGDQQWYDGVVATQKKLMEEMKLDTKYHDEIIKKMVEMKQKACAVCGCVGHISSYCWLNSQLYSECRGSA